MDEKDLFKALQGTEAKILKKRENVRLKKYIRPWQVSNLSIYYLSFYLSNYLSEAKILKKRENIRPSGRLIIFLSFCLSIYRGYAESVMCDVIKFHTFYRGFLSHISSHPFTVDVYLWHYIWNFPKISYGCCYSCYIYQSL